VVEGGCVEGDAAREGNRVGHQGAYEGEERAVQQLAHFAVVVEGQADEYVSEVGEELLHGVLEAGGGGGRGAGAAVVVVGVEHFDEFVQCFGLRHGVLFQQLLRDDQQLWVGSGVYWLQSGAKGIAVVMLVTCCCF
jgi:hypothetical protein